MKFRFEKKTQSLSRTSQHSEKPACEFKQSLTSLIIAKCRRQISVASMASRTLVDGEGRLDDRPEELWTSKKKSFSSISLSDIFLQIEEYDK